MKNNLTLEQNNVLNNHSNELIVSASAGTGKTTTLVAYIVKLIKSGVSPSKLLVVTFTNNAASEMRERIIKNMMGMDEKLTDKIDEMMNADISTIHAFLQKIIQKHIDKIEITNGYKIVDNNLLEEIKNRAYKKAIKIASEKENFEKLLLTINKENGLLKEIVFSLQNHFAVQSNPEKIFEKYINNQDKICEEANKYLSSHLAEQADFFASCMREGLETINESNKNFNYANNFIRALSDINKNNTLKQNIQIIKEMKLGRMNSSKEANEKMLYAKVQFKKIKDYWTKFDIEKEEFFIPNPLLIDVYNFYSLYLKELNKIKKDENVLDYNDLEKYADKLLEIPAVLQEIQSTYDYVFIDEYQDTNPVQERLIKLISKGANFIAVGDPKQGIYGFRNATSEIMKKDIARLEEKNSVCYLKQNFRSEKQILHFANDIFSKIMKIDNTGIDYERTSKFYIEDKSYQKENFVNIDVIKIKKSQEDTDNEEDYNCKTSVYDLSKEKLITKDKCEREAQVITRRINELLTKKIKDGEKERYINYSDITILVRKRGDLVSKLEESFARCKIPVISTIEKSIESNEEIEVLKNLLKLCVDERDDIALVSVLSSKLFSISLEEILLIRRINLEKSFYENFIDNERSSEFYKELNDFKLDAFSKGVAFALKNLLREKDFYTYVLYKTDGINKLNQIRKFIELIESSVYNYDFAGLINYINSKEIKIKGSESSSNAVTISTMHSSKGLEYPVCIIAGLGDKIISGRHGPNYDKYAINNDFGLGMNYYDFEKDFKSGNVVLKAIKTMKDRKEFIDEVMLLYVAITRAKKYLYLIGELESDNDVTQIDRAEDIFYNKTYLDLIMNSINANKFNVTIFSENIEPEVQEMKLISTSDSKMIDRFNEYLNYKYPYEDSTKIRYKNSVTALNKTEENNTFKIGGGNNLDVGIAYHKAIELLDFENTNNIKDIERQLNDVDFGDIKLDYNILLNNINSIKELVKNKKIFKEKEFTMKIKANEILENSCEDEIMVQGIIDLFAIGENNILIDYKYTNEKNPEKIKEKYYKQLILYKKAIEKSFNIKLDEIFLLSLKYGQIIKF